MAVGMSAAADRPAIHAIRPSTARGGLRLARARARLALGILVLGSLALGPLLLGNLALGALGAGEALADGFDPVRTPGAKGQFLRIQAAWSTRDAASVVAFVPKRGTLTLQLTSPRVSGTFKAAQAQKTLQQYFRGVTEASLKDVTEKNRRSPRNWLSRTYAYTYRPLGRDEVRTLLTITMKGDGRGTWWLNSIAERPLPRQR